MHAAIIRPCVVAEQAINLLEWRRRQVGPRPTQTANSRTMRDDFSLDQIRAFIASVEEGSFSAAARRLGCAQSAVSDLIRRLEEETGVQLFSRATRSPTLTMAGKLLLVDAKAIAEAANKLNSHARGMAQGVEPELCVVVDVYFPFSIIAEASKDFREAFPDVALRLYVEVLGGALEPVLKGRAGFAVVGGEALGPSSVVAERICDIELVPVAAPHHPLARLEGRIPCDVLARHQQLVLTERTMVATGRDHNVLSPMTWRLSDLFVKNSLLLNGLGWGFVPRHAVECDIDEGRLKVLSVEDHAPADLLITMSAVYRADAPPGPAGRWMIDKLQSAAKVVNEQGRLGSVNGLRNMA
jgi:DNA-binding transcriptional LysR family regulator